jgi:hypothetical protein
MTRPTRWPRPFSRARCCAPAVAIPAIFLLAGCGAAPPTAVANLEDLYRARDDQTGTYANEVTDRGWINTKGLAIRGIFGEPDPITEVEQLDNPIEFGLKNLAIVFDTSGETLDDFEWARAVAAAAEIGRIDPARILRSRGYETAALLLGSRRTGGERCEVKPVDEAALTTALAPLRALADAPRKERAAVIASHSADLLPAARALTAVRPGSFELCGKLLQLAARCGRLLARAKGQPDAEAELRTACHALAFQVAYLSALPDVPNLKGLFDSSSEARISAGRLLLAVDPAAATVELGKIWMHTPDPLVRVAWLQALAQSGLTGAGVHPTLRAPLLNEISSESENAAVRYWAKQAMATMLKMDVETATEAEVRAKWLALGDWDSGAKQK